MSTPRKNNNNNNNNNNAKGSFARSGPSSVAPLSRLPPKFPCVHHGAGDMSMTTGSSRDGHAAVPPRGTPCPSPHPHPHPSPSPRQSQSQFQFQEQEQIGQATDDDADNDDDDAAPVPRRKRIRSKRITARKRLQESLMAAAMAVTTTAKTTTFTGVTLEEDDKEEEQQEQGEKVVMVVVGDDNGDNDDNDDVGDEKTVTQPPPSQPALSHGVSGGSDDAGETTASNLLMTMTLWLQEYPKCHDNNNNDNGDDVKVVRPLSLDARHLVNGLLEKVFQGRHFDVPPWLPITEQSRSTNRHAMSSDDESPRPRPCFQQKSGLSAVVLQDSKTRRLWSLVHAGGESSTGSEPSTTTWTTKITPHRQRRQMSFPPIDWKRMERVVARLTTPVTVDCVPAVPWEETYYQDLSGFDPTIPFAFYPYPYPDAYAYAYPDYHPYYDFYSYVASFNQYYYYAQYFDMDGGQHCIPRGGEGVNM